MAKATKYKCTECGDTITTMCPPKLCEKCGSIFPFVEVKAERADKPRAGRRSPGRPRAA